MATAFHVSLVTPERVLFSGDAEEVSLRTDGGEISFLARHEDYVAALDITVVRIQSTGPANDLGDSASTGEVRCAVHGGFVHVDGSGVTILAGVAELATEIDVERARRALTAAESRAPEEHAGDATDRAGTSPAVLALLSPDAPEVAARRARVRLEAAGALATT